MKQVKYSMKLEISIVQDVDTLEDIKGSEEFAQDVCNMIADEASYINATTTYKILGSQIHIADKKENFNQCKIVS